MGYSEEERMESLTKFWRLPRQDKWLLAEAFAFVVASRIALWTRRKDRAWQQLELPIWTAEGANAERLAWAVSVTAARIPKASCLTQALAGREMLKRRGIASEIRIGVQLEGEFKAHAWLVQDGKILLGGDTAESYSELGALPRGKTG